MDDNTSLKISINHILLYSSLSSLYSVENFDLLISKRAKQVRHYQVYHNEKSEIYFCLFTYIYGCTYVVCSYVSLVVDTIPISLNRIPFFFNRFLPELSLCTCN